MSAGKGSRPRITKKYSENFDQVFRKSQIKVEDLNKLFKKLRKMEIL